MSVNRNISGIPITPRSTHRADTYATDCHCEKRIFALFNEAKRHMESCPEAGAVLYRPAYGEPLVSLRKEN